MDFLQDATWQDDPSVTVSDITTTGSYALSVNGAFNAASLSLQGIDINNIFISAANSKTAINTCNIYSSNIFTSNIVINNSLSQTGNDDINFKGNLLTTGNISIGSTNNTNKNLLVGGIIRVTSNIHVDSNIITTNIRSESISNIGIFSNIGSSVFYNSISQSGGNVSLLGKVGIGGTDFTSNLFVSGKTVITNNVGIGTTNTNDFRLNVLGNTKLDGSRSK